MRTMALGLKLVYSFVNFIIPLSVTLYLYFFPLCKAFVRSLPKTGKRIFRLLKLLTRQLNFRRPYEVVYVTISNQAFCLAFYLIGVHFRGELQHVGQVGEQKIKCQPIKT